MKTVLKTGEKRSTNTLGLFFSDTRASQEAHSIFHQFKNFKSYKINIQDTFIITEILKSIQRRKLEGDIQDEGIWCRIQDPTRQYSLHPALIAVLGVYNIKTIPATRQTLEFSIPSDLSMVDLEFLKTDLNDAEKLLQFMHEELLNTLNQTEEKIQNDFLMLQDKLYLPVIMNPHPNSGIFLRYPACHAAVLRLKALISEHHEPVRISMPEEDLILAEYKLPKIKNLPTI